jgi:hypothetical protein
MDGGTGDDLLVIGRFDPGPFGTPPPAIDGGAGFDTLAVNARTAFDLTGADGANLSGIEKIDMTDNPLGGTALTLDLASIVSLLAAADTLFVDGDAADSIIAGGAFANAGPLTRGGVTYNQWTLGDTNLLIDTDVGVTFV